MLELTLLHHFLFFELCFEVIELDGIRISRVIMKKDTPFIDKEEQEEIVEEDETL